MSSQLVEKVLPLLNSQAPTLQTLLQQQIDMLNDLNKKFSDLDLTDATRISLASIAGGQQPNAAIAVTAVLVKNQARTQGVEIADQDANVIAQAVTNGVLATIQAAVSAPTHEATPST